MRIPALFLILIGLPAAQAAEGKRLTLPALWVSAEVPETWIVSAGDSGFEPGRQPDPAHPLGITVQWMDSGQSEMRSYLKSRTELASWQRKTRGTKEFKSGPERREGAWRWVETREKKDAGETLIALEAVRAAPGGFYSLVFYARESYFSAHRPTAQKVLDTFRRDAPRLGFAGYTDPGGRFEIMAPTAPWVASNDTTEGVLRFIGTSGPGRTPPPILSLRWVPQARRWGGAKEYLRSKLPKAADRVTTIQVPAGTAHAADFEGVISTRDLPEIAGHPDFPKHTREAVIEKGDGFYCLSLLSSPATQADWAPAFTRALQTLRLKGP